MAPSALASGIVIYEHADYLGASAHITADIKDLADFKGPCVAFETSGTTTTTKDVWNDCVSSIRVAPGWEATLYRDDDFGGEQLKVTQDMPNLQLAPGGCSKGGFNDCASAIRVRRP
jgi:hypothetical protein